MAASKARVTLYKKALSEVADAKVYAEKCRAAILKAGCPHPDEFQVLWTVQVYQIGGIDRGAHCTICDQYMSAFSSAGWVDLKTAEYENEACCPHREEWRTDYKWHHGYGNYVTGDQCGNCDAKRSFKSQGTWAPKSEWMNWRRVGDDD